ncbi:S9 family peptidase [Kitasatospora viridis]|uniref:Prolyl oligopeptidase family protein n=1 Tax=Kitasatospora viridis TaxID=281105 RepID=A0A561ULP7_9ACTN|nr:alpha/beta fold hydrolase [Kitasatospora viridis]TWG00306.1 prolyl oligopeptidase family protein [Kitasatospora viridis]
MNTAVRALAPAQRRLSFTFAADGSHAACLAAGPDSGWYAESWRLRPGLPAEPVALPLAAQRSENLRTQLLALPDGRVLACRHDGERHDLVLLAPGGNGEPATETSLATLRMLGLRLLAVPSADGAPDAPVAVALGTDITPTTRAWLLFADGRPPRQVAEFPGLHGGGVWLDRTGRLLALDRVRAGVVKTVVLDLRLGTVTPLLEIAERSNDRLVLFDPDTRFLLLRSDAPGEDRLGWGVLGGAAPVRFPECLHVPGLFLRPVVLEPGAASADRTRVAIQVDHGVTSALALWEPTAGRLEPLAVPPGRLGAIGHWSAAGLRMPYSAPDHPTALATLRVDQLRRPLGGSVGGTGALPLSLAPLSGPRLVPNPAAPGQVVSGQLTHGQVTGQVSARVPGLVPAQVGGAPVTPETGWRLDGSAPPTDGGRWHGAQSLELAGPAGPIEAVVYGGEAWLSSPHLVIALHGGPADAWRLEFDPALQRMAAEGLAVLAPNQRGSTGYGEHHAMAVKGAWGGPDLADVLALLEGVAGQRAAIGLEPPALFGVSYGAFLALLAVAHASGDRVSRCAVVAPFLSGGRLLAEAAPPVRALTSRLGGDEPLHDALGPRDVLALADRLTAPLLIVHGERDEVIPVSQSRALRHELLRLGRTEGSDFRYVEAAGTGHEVLAEEGSAVLHELLAGFLRTGRPV